MLKNLYSHMNINNCIIPNRLIVPAMVTNYCNKDGTANDKFIRYHEEKAKGGWGLIITEDYRISENAGGYEFVPGLWNDIQIESHRRLTDRIHNYDSKIFCQIYHAGRQTNEKINGGVQPVAPSPVPCALMGVIPKELTREEIREIVMDFGSAALRAKKCGFDGVEIHGGHGYLISQFLSTYSNKRTDEYGGCLYNRMRFVREIYDEVRSRVGYDYPITIRISADEFVPGGNTIAEARVVAMELEKSGFDALNVSASVYFNYPTTISAPMSVPHAWLSNYAEEMKKVVKIPIITVNRINDPLIAESLICAGKTDFVAMGRASLADPYLPNKAKDMRFEEIRQCIGCLQGCIGGIHNGGEVRCLVNPELGKEYRNLKIASLKKKKIFIAGGGIAGIVAALVSSERGHDVTLFEKADKLGGQFIPASYPPNKGEFSSYLSWLIRELEKSKVKVLINKQLTKNIIDYENPDNIIIATGGKPIIPNIPGINNPIVCTAEDLLLGKIEYGNKIVIAGGGEVGAETASMLGLLNRNVILVEMTDSIASAMKARVRQVLLGLLDEYRVNVKINTKLIEIRKNSVILESNGTKEEIFVDNVVIALGYKPDNSLFDELSPYYNNVISISGASKTSNAITASKDGFEVGCYI